jgi:hypothetical protein
VVAPPTTSSGDAIDWTFHALTGILPKPKANAMSGQRSRRIAQFGLRPYRNASLIEYDMVVDTCDMAKQLLQARAL